MKLVYKSTSKEVKQGDVLTSFRGEKYIASYWREPSHGIGKISVKKDAKDILCCAEYYVSVFDLEWK